MDTLRLSESQRGAVLDASPRVLVSAGAGSGKTTLLVAYFIRALVDEGVPAHDLVAVTFTRKAASELSARVRERLLQLGRDDLARALDLSTVGTIHSLCRRLIRDHAFQAEVDPAFAVIEADAAAMLKQEVSAVVWDREVADADEEELGVLASNRLVLQRELVSLYDRLRQVGQEIPHVAIEVGLRQEGAEAGLSAAIRNAQAAAEGMTRRTKTLEGDLCRIGDCLHLLEASCREPDMAATPAQAAEAALRATSELFPSRRTTSMEEWFEPVREAMTAYRRCLANEIGEPLVEAMNSLLARFHQAYTAAKRERGVLDFADLELQALALIRRILKDGEPPFGPKARVMVDEFQDTNELQCAILENLGAAGLLMVGDEKQSIYRFRGADVAVFKRRESELGGDDVSGAARISARGLHRLAENYRSSEAIVAFVNRLFSSPLFFGSDFAGLLYARPPGEEQRAADTVVDVVVACRSDEQQSVGRVLPIYEAEAQAVAWEVRRLLDDEGWEPRDIAVLTPALTHSDTLQECLSQCRIDTYLVRGKGYYSRDEVSDIRALLQVLGNPQDDLAMVTVLRSPLVGLSDDALFMLGREAGGSGLSLWEILGPGCVGSLPGKDREALDRFLATMSSIRPRLGRPGLARLIDDLISALAYDLCTLVSDEGDRRFANIRKLMRLADQHEALYGPDVSGFAEVVRGMDELADAEGNAPTLAEEENVVRIMSVHQAKGLEFPVVVITGLGSDVRADDASSFVVAADGRVGLFLKNSKRDNYEAHDFSLGPAREIAEEAEAQKRLEDLRLLYVAMTRAEDRLILVGAGPSGGGMEGSRLGRIMSGLGLDSCPCPDETVVLPDLAAAVSCISPTTTAAARTGSQDILASVPATEEAAGQPLRKASPPLFLDSSCPAILPRSLSFSAINAFRQCPRRFYLERVLGLYPGESSQQGSTAASVRLNSEENDPDGSVEARAWLDEGEGKLGMEVGLLVHGLLQRLPLVGPPPDREAVCRSAREDAIGRTLTAGSLERAVDLVLAFWRSPISTLPGLTVGEKEMPFCFSHGDVILSGIMDLAWREGTSWSIVDYKTNALGQRTPAEVAKDYSLQTCVYSLAGLKTGASDVWMHFLFLERPDKLVTLHFGSEDLGRLEATLDQTLGEMGRCDFSAAPGADCGRCDFTGVCKSVGRSVDPMWVSGDGPPQRDGIQ